MCADSVEDDPDPMTPAAVLGHGWRYPGVGVLPGSAPVRPINNGIPMNKTSIGFGIARRLYAVSAVVSLALAALAVYALSLIHI